MRVQSTRLRGRGARRRHFLMVTGLWVWVSAIPMSVDDATGKTGAKWPAFSTSDEMTRQPQGAFLCLPLNEAGGDHADGAVPQLGDIGAGTGPRKNRAVKRLNSGCPVSAADYVLKIALSPGKSVASASIFTKVCAFADVTLADNRSTTMNLSLNRLIVALMVSVGLVSGTAAQSLGETYATAQAIFGAVPAQIVADIEGKWLPLSQLTGGIEATADPEMVSTMMERFCEKAPLEIEITARSETAIIVTTSKAGTSLVESYDWLEGTRFAYSADPDALVAFLGLESASAESKASAIAARPNRVALYRTAPDLLVIAPEVGQNSIYGRCP